MPKLSDDEVKAKIADGSISALTIDTNVFDKYGCNLDFAIFRRLDQFAGSAVAVLFSEIIVREVMRHIAEEAAETQRALKKALLAHGKRWKIDPAEVAPVASYRAEDDSAVVADEQFEIFRGAVNGVVVPALGMNDRTHEILDRYFSVITPFENKDAKKNEFPDAFALMSLEAHAQREGMSILCVSADKGWADFCAESERLVCIADLNQALSFFNESGRLVAEAAINLLRAGQTEEMTSAIESAIEYRLDDVDFNADGWSSVEFETEPLSATLQSVDWEAAGAPVVIAADDDVVTFTTLVAARVSFEASFRFEVRDSIDRDYVSLGSEDVSKDVTVDFELAITVPRDPDEGMDSIEVEVARRHIQVDFGTVEPFQSENPHHERY